MSQGKREPKNLADYCSVELAAKGLEDVAADLRKNQREGDYVKWDLNIRFWNDDWKPKSTPQGEGKG